MESSNHSHPERNTPDASATHSKDHAHMEMNADGATIKTTWLIQFTQTANAHTSRQATATKAKLAATRTTAKLSANPSNKESHAQTATAKTNIDGLPVVKI